jgi:catalase
VTAPTATPAAAVDAANEAFGRHPHARALHAKGILMRGTFTAAPVAAGLTRAAHMQGGAIPATIRFSNAGGNPDVPDYAPDVRGLAVKLYLPDGSRTDIVAQSAPRFPVRTPEAFIELLHAQHPGPAMAWKLPRFLARHPEVISTLPANLAALRPPTSYAACRYYAVHAYRFLDSGGGARFVRYTLVPEAGEARLGPRAAKRRGRDFLQQEIAERLNRGPVRFSLELQIAAPGDNVDDPASIWPKDRQRVSAGTIEITGRETERERDGDVLVFDPTRVVDGIELSDDPVLRFRRGAYSESVSRRTSG